MKEDKLILFLDTLKETAVIAFLIACAASLVSIAIDVHIALQEFLAIPIYD